MGHLPFHQADATELVEPLADNGPTLKSAHQSLSRGVMIHASLMFPADQVLPYMVRNTDRLPPTFFRTPLGTPFRIGPTHPTSVTSVPDPWISAPDTAPHISHDHCVPFVGMGLYAYL